MVPAVERILILGMTPLAAQLLRELATGCEVVVVAGNHDRQLRGQVEMVESLETERFHFHHGHCAAETRDRIQIIGHHHPAAVITDGAGLRLKCPAFVQQASCWIMPAFSPWASGTRWAPDDESRVWLCTEERVFALDSGSRSPVGGENVARCPS